MIYAMFRTRHRAPHLHLRKPVWLTFASRSRFVTLMRVRETFRRYVCGIKWTNSVVVFLNGNREKKKVVSIVARGQSVLRVLIAFLCSDLSRKSQEIATRDALMARLLWYNAFAPRDDKCFQQLRNSRFRSIVFPEKEKRNQKCLRFRAVSPRWYDTKSIIRMCGTYTYAKETISLRR